jgi:hypothetical protein
MRNHHTENAPVRIMRRQPFLLDFPESLGRGCVAGQNDEDASTLKKELHGLTGIFINHVEGLVTVRGAGIVAEIQIVVLGQLPQERPQYGQPTKAGIEYTDHDTLKSPVDEKVN